MRGMRLDFMGTSVFALVRPVRFDWRLTFRESLMALQRQTPLKNPMEQSVSRLQMHGPHTNLQKRLHGSRPEGHQGLLEQLNPTRSPVPSNG